MFNIATIITADHLDKAYTMYKSMNEFNHCRLHVLIVDSQPNDMSPPNLDGEISFYKVEDLFGNYTTGAINRLIYTKYSTPPKNRPTIISKYDYLRWALKAGFVHYLLSVLGNDLVIYCDSDLYFYNDYSSIVEYAQGKSITLSPHWRTIYTTPLNEIEYNFKHGLYNGGFFIATKEAISILEWWAERCCVECSASSNYTYVDQKYFDLVPLYFDNVGIIMGKGCNVAAWNFSYLKRSIKDGDILVEGDKIIFIHYSPITIKYIDDGIDVLLAGHLKKYRDNLMNNSIEFHRQGKARFTSTRMQQSEVI